MSTKRLNGNKCPIEGIFNNKLLADEFGISNHFKQAKILFGQTTYSLNDLFPEYKFKYITILREPIERTISNIAQFSNVLKGKIKFGAFFSRLISYPMNIGILFMISWPKNTQFLGF